MKRTDFTTDAPGHFDQIPEGVEAFVPDALPPPRAAFDPLSCAGLVDEAMANLGALRHGINTTPGATRLIDSFMRREAVRSSKIEGTHTQLSELLLFEIGEAGAEPGDAEDAEQVRRNLDAFHLGLAQVENLQLTGRIFREMHALLLDGSPAKLPGQYRRTSSRIGGRILDTPRESFEDARFVPPPASQVQQCMKELEEFINIPTKYNQLPLLVQAALLHYQFETIHPFSDGNGRIGRLAIALLLKVRGLLPQPILCLSAYMDRHHEEYTDRMLAVSQRGEWREWVGFFINGVKEQATEDSERCRRLMLLRDSYLRMCDKGSVSVVVVDSLFQFPVTTISKVAELQGSGFNAGTRCVAELEQAGMLFEVTGRKTNRIYIAQPIIDLLEGPLAP